MFQLHSQQQFWVIFFSAEHVCCIIATNYVWHFRKNKKTKNKTSVPAEFLVVSVKYLSAVEGVCLHLPLPLKGRPSLGHMFPPVPNKDVRDQNLKTLSHTSFRCWMLCIPHRHFFTTQGGLFILPANEANQPRTFPLTAQKAGLVPALALTLHLFGKVDCFLAAAALVSSSERHPEK